MFQMFQKHFKLVQKIAKQKITKKMFGNISKCSKKLFAWEVLNNKQFGMFWNDLFGKSNSECLKKDLQVFLSFSKCC